jgi:hypothetical protein
MWFKIRLVQALLLGSKYFYLSFKVTPSTLRGYPLSITQILLPLGQMAKL